MAMHGTPQIRVEDLAGGQELLRRLERIEALLPQLAAKEAQQAPPPQSPASPQELQVEDFELAVPEPLAGLSCCVDQTVPATVDLAESVYSDFVITCARGRPWPIITSAGVLVLCMLIQGTFAVMVSEIATESVTTMAASPGANGTKFNLYTAWRELNDVDDVWGSESDYRGLICSGKTWEWEASMASNMADYAKKSWLTAGAHANGKVFGFLAITLWAGYIMKEFRSIGNFFCLLSLGRPPNGKSAYTFDAASKEGRLNGVSIGTGIAIVVVGVFRILLTFFLGLYGCKFLSFSTSLGEFILNSVALLFIIDIDDLCFALMLSRDKQKAVRSIQPPNIKGGVGRVISTLSPYSEVIASVACLVVVLILRLDLSKFSDAYIDAAYLEVCKDYATN
mmetsp:Transcript_31815/g.93001  ORF Transcript_31815/g.93001 Transcript_31815/m.93001 type:complete len:395 (+) Transcript_31815:105-1289(+)